MHPRINADALARLRQRRLEMITHHPEAEDVTPPELRKQIEGTQPVPAHSVPIAHINPALLGKTLADIVNEKLKEHRGFNIDPEAFGAAVGEQLREMHEEIMKRIEGMQARVDKCVTFAGEWQAALDYPKGALVKKGHRLLIATKPHRSGDSIRWGDGTGWEKVFENKEEKNDIR